MVVGSAVLASARHVESRHRSPGPSPVSLEWRLHLVVMTTDPPDRNRDCAPARASRHRPQHPQERPDGYWPLHVRRRAPPEALRRGAESPGAYFLFHEVGLDPKEDRSR